MGDRYGHFPERSPLTVYGGRDCVSGGCNVRELNGWHAAWALVRPFNRVVDVRIRSVDATACGLIWVVDNKPCYEVRRNLTPLWEVPLRCFPLARTEHRWEGWRARAQAVNARQA